MADHTKIEWTDATWNPITGCTLVSDGCRNCYAAQLAATRLKHHPSRVGLARLNADGVAKFTGEVRFNEQWLDEPLRWKKPRMIFVGAHGDLFHESVPQAWLIEVFARIVLAPQHIYQILTKRPERQRKTLSDADFVRQVYERVCDLTLESRLPVVLIAEPAHERFAPAGTRIRLGNWPLPNVWVGTSVEDQPTADERIPELLSTPAAIRWISAEPLLGPLNLNELEVGDGTINALRPDTWEELKEIWRNSADTWEEDFADWYEIDFDSATGPTYRSVDWIVAGGESGRHARPIDPNWLRDLRDQCAAAHVPFLFKQWGEWGPKETCPDAFERFGMPADCMHWPRLPGQLENNVWKLGKRRAGRLLDGVEHNAFPEVQS